MKRGRVFLTIVCFCMCAIGLQQVKAAPQLDLWMTGNFNSISSTITAEVRRTNTDFGLGGLAYNLQFSESLNLTREYSPYGWVANDGLFDNSNPIDGSAYASFSNIHFETVHSPAGTEFSAGSGFIEAFTVELSDQTPRWIYFDIVSPSASDGSGQDLVTSLGGTINIDPGPPPGHTLAVYIPEPVSIALLGLGGLAILRRRRR